MQADLCAQIARIKYFEYLLMQPCLFRRLFCRNDACFEFITRERIFLSRIKMLNSFLIQNYFKIILKMCYII